MGYGFDPSLILAASPREQRESPGSQIRDLFQAREQSQIRQATLADMLRKQQQEARLADILRQNAGNFSDPTAQAYARGGFGDQAYEAQKQAAEAQQRIVENQKRGEELKKIRLDVLRGRAAGIQSQQQYDQFRSNIDAQTQAEYGFGEQYNPKAMRSFVEAGRQPPFVMPIQAYDAQGGLNLVDPKTGKPRPVEGMVKPLPGADKAGRKFLNGYSLSPDANPTDEEMSKVRAAQASARTMVQTIGDIQALYKQYGNAPLPGPARARMEQLVTDLQLSSKGPEMYQLGVIAGPDMDLLNKAISNPTSKEATILDFIGNEQSMARIGSFRGQILRRFDNKARSLGFTPDAAPAKPQAGARTPEQEQRMRDLEARAAGASR